MTAGTELWSALTNSAGFGIDTPSQLDPPTCAPRLVKPPAHALEARLNFTLQRFVHELLHVELGVRYYREQKAQPECV